MDLLMSITPRKFSIDAKKKSLAEHLKDFYGGNYIDKTNVKKSTVYINKIKWPFWARVLKRLKISSDKGIGDTVERLLGESGERFKKFMEKHKIDCKCKNRRDRWNFLYPYQP